MQLNEAIKLCQQVRWDRTRGEQTAMCNALQAQQHFGPSARLDAITLPAMDTWVSTMRAQGSTDGTINRKLAALSAVLRVAHERGHLGVLPRVPRLREAPHRLRWLAPNETAHLLACLEGPARRLTAFLLDTGLRLGEVAKADVRDGMVHIWESKADKPRTVPLTSRAATAWAAMGRLPTTSSYQHQFAKACVKAGITGASPHTLRHTFASNLVQRGVPLASIQALLGHRSITTTMRYAHISDASLVAAIGVLDSEAECGS